MVDQEAGHAGELVLLHRNNLDQQLFVRQVRAGKVNAFGGVGLFDIKQGSLGSALPGLDGLQGFVGRLVLWATRGAS